MYIHRELDYVTHISETDRLAIVHNDTNSYTTGNAWLSPPFSNCHYQFNITTI
jgi:hypothetical protein